MERLVPRTWTKLAVSKNGHSFLSRASARIEQQLRRSCDANRREIELNSYGKPVPLSRPWVRMHRMKDAQELEGHATKAARAKSQVKMGGRAEVHPRS
eukprot:scaffold942_cov394-Pavlova_lutheri.AAC.4